jgi:hypothetical protein
MAKVCTEERLIFLLYQKIIVSVIGHCLDIIILLNTLHKHLQCVQNETMRLILICAKCAVLLVITCMLISVRCKHILVRFKCKTVGTNKNKKRLLFGTIDDFSRAHLKKVILWIDSCESLKLIIIIDIFPSCQTMVLSCAKIH